MEVVAEAGAQQPWDQFKEEVEIMEEEHGGGGGAGAVEELLTREIRKRLDHAHGSSNGNGAHHANGGEEEGEDNANGGEQEEDEVQVAPEEEEHKSIFLDPAKGPSRSKATSAGKSPMEGQGPARSKAPSARSKAPSASHGPSSSQAPKQSGAANSKRKATSDLNAPKAKRRAPNSTSNTTRGYVNVSSGSGAARGSNALGTGGKKKYARFRSLLGFQDNV